MIQTGLPTHLFNYVHQIGWGGLSLSSRCKQLNSRLQRLHTKGHRHQSRQPRLHGQLQTMRMVKA